MISGVLTVKVWQRPQVIFLDTVVELAAWMGAAVLRQVYEDNLSSLLDQKCQDPSGAAYCYPNCRKTLLINRGVGCLRARILLDPVSSCVVLGCCTVLS